MARPPALLAMALSQAKHCRLAPGHRLGRQVRNIHRAQYCAIHRTSRYELYCEDCERLICNECARHDHQQCSYRLPSASLIEKHRQRVKDIIESLCHKLLDDQALQKLLSQSVESSEMACMQARSNISAAFDELNRAAELRCAELLQHVQENGRQPLSALLAEKERCSAALVDVWCVIDFMEKVNKHGTDVEVLMAKSHLFRDPIGSQKFQEWQNLVAAPLPGFERSRVGLPSHDAESMLRSLASFGSVQVNALHPLTWEMSGRGPLKITEGKTWADVFEESEDQLQLARHPLDQEELPVDVNDAETDVVEAPRGPPQPRRRRRRRRKGGEERGEDGRDGDHREVLSLSAPSDEPAWVEGMDNPDAGAPTDASRRQANIEMEPQKVALDENEESQQKARRRRRRRPRGRGKPQESEPVD